MLDRAFESCFVHDDPAETVAESPLLPVMALSCADSWGDKVAQIQTAFGTLAFAAGYRDRVTATYRDADSERQYGEAETARVLQRIHKQAFSQWLNLNLDQQTRDLQRYLAGTSEDAARLSFEQKAIAEMLAPSDAKPQEMQLFAQDLAAVLDALCPRQTVVTAIPGRAGTRDRPLPPLEDGVIPLVGAGVPACAEFLCKYK